MAVWPSWPQAWWVPVVVERYGWPRSVPVHVGPQQHRFARFIAAQHAHHAGLAHAGADLIQTEAPESFGYDPGRPMLLVGELRMAVKIAPKLDQLFALRGGEH